MIIEKQNQKGIRILFLKLLWWTEFDYKSICNQFITTHYMIINKILHVYFSYMIYLMSYVTFVNNICEWSYKILCNEL